MDSKARHQASTATSPTQADVALARLYLSPLRRSCLLATISFVVCNAALRHGPIAQSLSPSLAASFLLNGLPSALVFGWIYKGFHDGLATIREDAASVPGAEQRLKEFAYRIVRDSTLAIALSGILAATIQFILTLRFGLTTVAARAVLDFALPLLTVGLIGRGHVAWGYAAPILFAVLNPLWLAFSWRLIGHPAFAELTGPLIVGIAVHQMARGARGPAAPPVLPVRGDTKGHSEPLEESKIASLPLLTAGGALATLIAGIIGMLVGSATNNGELQNYSLKGPVLLVPLLSLISLVSIILAMFDHTRNRRKAKWAANLLGLTWMLVGALYLTLCAIIRSA